jgi:hypothetical protein
VNLCRHDERTECLHLLAAHEPERKPALTVVLDVEVVEPKAIDPIDAVAPVLSVRTLRARWAWSAGLTVAPVAPLRSL